MGIERYHPSDDVDTDFFVLMGTYKMGFLNFDL